MKRLGFSQKRTVGALERDEFSRATWKAIVAERVEPSRLVFVDVMGTNTSLSAVYAWAPKGRRAYWSVPCNRGANTTVLSSMSMEGWDQRLARGGIHHFLRVFEAYVQSRSWYRVCVGVRW
jgi:hypothetical protein